MIESETQDMIRDFQCYIRDKAYPCIAARSAMTQDHILCFVADHMACPKDDSEILRFLYDFIAQFRKTKGSFHSAVILFKAPEISSEELFDHLLWQRLQALSQLDARKFEYDKRVSSDPSAPDFSFSLGEEAFFIIGLHPASNRRARKFKHPAMVFNPHAQFEALRETNRYEKMKKTVRQRDILFSGSVNPMLADFGHSSEVYQYSGRRYEPDWKCPLDVIHKENQHHV